MFKIKGRRGLWCLHTAPQDVHTASCRAPEVAAGGTGKVERREMLRKWQEVPFTPPPSAVTRSELKQTEQRLLLLLPCSRPVPEGTAHSRIITPAVPGLLVTRCPLPGSCSISALLGEGHGRDSLWAYQPYLMKHLLPKWSRVETTGGPGCSQHHADLLAKCKDLAEGPERDIRIK